MNVILSHVFLGFLNVMLVLLLAPLGEGIIRKVTARIQSRQGPPLQQSYLDILKLLGKEDLESGTSPRLQRFAAYLSLASILAVASLLPMTGPSPLGAGADIILLVYLLTLSGIATLLAGLAAGSVYSLIGMSREMMAMMALEPILGIALVIGAVHAGSLRLDDVLTGAAFGSAGFPWAGIVMLVVALFALQAFVGRLPFDTAEAETEIMEGPLVEYSGPKLGIFKLARMAKLLVYAALLVNLFVPWGSASIFPINVVVLFAKVLAVVLLVTLVGATHARFRIDQAIRAYAGMFGLSMVALVLAVIGL